MNPWDYITLEAIIRAVGLSPRDARREFPSQFEYIIPLADDLGFWQWANAASDLPSAPERKPRDLGRHLAARRFLPRKGQEPRVEPPPAWTPEWAVRKWAASGFLEELQPRSRAERMRAETDNKPGMRAGVV